MDRTPIYNNVYCGKATISFFFLKINYIRALKLFHSSQSQSYQITNFNQILKRKIILLINMPPLAAFVTTVGSVLRLSMHRWCISFTYWPFHTGFAHQALSCYSTMQRPLYSVKKEKPLFFLKTIKINTIQNTMQKT